MTLNEHILFHLKWNICHITYPAVQENHNKSIKKIVFRNLRHLNCQKLYPNIVATTTGLRFQYFKVHKLVYIRVSYTSNLVQGPFKYQPHDTAFPAPIQTSLLKLYPLTIDLAKNMRKAIYLSLYTSTSLSVSDFETPSKRGTPASRKLEG